MRIPALVMMAIIAACTTNTMDESGAWRAYQAFDRALAAEPDPRWAIYLSDRIAADLASASEADRQQIIRQVIYPRWLRAPERHYAKRTAEGVCLTVVGVANDGGPASVSVQYALENGSFKADDFHYQLAEQTEQLPQQAQCPSEFRSTFP